MNYRTKMKDTLDAKHMRTVSPRVPRPRFHRSAPLRPRSYKTACNPNPPLL